MKCAATRRSRKSPSRAARHRGASWPTGERIAADVVVSNADSAWTYRTSCRPKCAASAGPTASSSAARYSMSLFVWYFGTNRRYEDVPHHMILLGPRYRELLSDIFERKVLAEDFSLYLHRPTATDPSLAPPGCDAFYVLSPVPHLEADTDWTRGREPYPQGDRAGSRSGPCCPAWRPPW
jgi:phytoene desaturase